MSASRGGGAEAMREACAKVAETLFADSGYHSAYRNGGIEIAAAIRALPLPAPETGGQRARAIVGIVIRRVRQMVAMTHDDRAAFCDWLQREVEAVLAVPKC